MEYFLNQFYNLNSFLFRVLEEASTTKIACNSTLGEANYNTANDAIIPWETQSLPEKQNE